MALNKFMHPRNPYRSKKPDFKALAAKYDEFKAQCSTDAKGHVHLDFKKPECLKALTLALLKEDFDLDLELPLDRLIPTIPLRLNYILWLEDVFERDSSVLKGIDIGTGASCIYPLLAAKKNQWKFLASELDATNFTYAVDNVKKNNLDHHIKVVKPSDPCGMLCDILMDSEESYDFCMCNPPFFGSNLEAWGMLTSRSDSRPDPISVNTASPQESVVPGGEVQFVKQMISDSLVLKNRIRVYTSMLGKKSSLSVLKEELVRSGVSNTGSTELCQGRTMRWVIAWSFDNSIMFPKSLGKKLLQVKPPPPIVWKVPETYTEQSIEDVLLKLLADPLQMTVENKEQSYIVTAFQNTWSHQRRQRRLKERAVLSPEKITPQKRQDDGDAGVSDNKKLRTDDSIAPDETNSCAAVAQASTSHPANPLLKFEMTVNKDGKDVLVEAKLLESGTKDFLHQVLQFLKNRVK